MCLGILRDGEWKPNSRLHAALEYVRQLLLEPVVDDAIEANIAKMYRDDHKEYVRTAKKWTKDHAKSFEQ